MFPTVPRHMQRMRRQRRLMDLAAVVFLLALSAAITWGIARWLF